ncbi:MAG: choice-of-anchor U domain-containing protein, partial [Acidobacteriota bacterium]
VTPGGTSPVTFTYPIAIPPTARFWGINRSQAWVSLSLTASGSKRVLQVQDGGPLDLDGQADGRVTFRGGLGLAPLFFSQFGDGLGQLSSQILVLNLDTQGSANVDFRLSDDGGVPLATDLDGVNIQGEHSVVIPAGGLSALATDGVGNLKVGSVAAYGDRALSGVIVFRGPAGVAGVGAGEVLSEGFVAPVESNTATGVDTGIAVMNLADEERLLSLTLLDPDGQSLATAQTEIAGLGHLALFAHQFTWQPAISFANFTGLLRVEADGSLAATVLQTRPGEFVTLPVVPLGSVPATGGTLYFAHFGAGLDLLGSQIILFNRHETAPAQATLTVRDDQGKVPSMSLNGVAVGPLVQVTVPPKGLRVLSTGSQGDLVSGSVRVTSPQPLAGVIVFSGSVGAAGVGSSPRIESGFSAPMETDRSRGLNTGVALMNAGTRNTTLSLSLYDASGHRLARAAVSLPVNGHKALFVDQFQWDTTLDFTRFQGILKVAPSDPISATVLQTRPGQFATMPVAVTP